MGLVTLTKDLYQPGVRDGHKILVARAGTRIDERVARAHGAEIAAAPAPADTSSDASVPSGAYDGMKVDELRELAAERGVDVDGLKKAEIVDALEYDDESRGA